MTAILYAIKCEQSSRQVIPRKIIVYCFNIYFCYKEEKQKTRNILNSNEKEIKAKKSSKSQL